ncbi:hypothetical protein FBZ89_104259 [Nitrospirillum amazonense]|uniref:Uncharacterized protein n=1 Tax=Nitrospirillum amazonense TaxID=28077 RepID=A0A560FK72_9PROT|nr:hypothetical protein FBZ89_104259 [Nitrospirillum amazonense]
MPKDGNGIPAHDCIDGYQRQSFELRLSDKHAVEWILVMRRQGACPRRVGDIDTEWRETRFRQLFFNAVQWKLQSTQGLLD